MASNIHQSTAESAANSKLNTVEKCLFGEGLYCLSQSRTYSNPNNTYAGQRKYRTHESLISHMLMLTLTQHIANQSSHSLGRPDLCFRSTTSHFKATQYPLLASINCDFFNSVAVLSLTYLTRKLFSIAKV